MYVYTHICIIICSRLKLSTYYPPNAKSDSFSLKRLIVNQVEGRPIFKTQESSFGFIFLGPHLSERCLANEVLQKRRSWDGITDILKEQRNIFSTSTVTHIFYCFHEMTCTVRKWHLPSILQYITKCSDFTHKSSTEEEQWDTSSVFLCFQSVLGMVGMEQGQEHACSCSLTAKGDREPQTLPTPTQALCF